MLQQLAAAPLPRNQNIELAPYLATDLAALWAEFPHLAPWTTDEAGLLLPFYPQYARLEQVQVLGLNPSYSAKDRNLGSYEPRFDDHA